MSILSPNPFYFHHFLQFSREKKSNEFVSEEFFLHINEEKMSPMSNGHFPLMFIKTDIGREFDLSFINIDLSKLRFLFLSRMAWHTHTRARTYQTEKKRKKTCMKRTVLNRKQNSRRARDEGNKKNNILLYKVNKKKQKKIENSFRKWYRLFSSIILNVICTYQCTSAEIRRSVSSKKRKQTSQCSSSTKGGTVGHIWNKEWKRSVYWIDKG